MARDMDTPTKDMTTSPSTKFKKMDLNKCSNKI